MLADRILAYITEHGPASTIDLVKALSSHERSIRRLLGELRDAGKIVQVFVGRAPTVFRGRKANGRRYVYQLAPPPKVYPYISATRYIPPRHTGTKPGNARRLAG